MSQKKLITKKLKEKIQPTKSIKRKSVSICLKHILYSAIRYVFKTGFNRIYKVISVKG